MEHSCDFLVIGTGLAGLSYALKAAEHGRVIVLSKKEATQTNTRWAQGGIAAVTATEDSFERHIHDTLAAGAGLCKPEIVQMVVEQAPARIIELQKWGIKFDVQIGNNHEPALAREGGHSLRRVLHVADHTGQAIHEVLLQRCRQNKNIQILERHFAIDLLTSRKLTPFDISANFCLGAYVLDVERSNVITLTAKITVLATGGAGKVYLYTTNWEGATGDGVALAHRAGARVANLEFMQFHPTCLYHPLARNFLISEALRGEGAELINSRGEAFMKKYHSAESLAPRDIVARSIDAEMKRTGAECVFLDIRHKTKDFIVARFPVIYEQCLNLGIDITKQPIPVVPAAHYLCGGVMTDENGRSDVAHLYAIGETACTGLHGANRLASNSLLECAVFAHNAFVHSHRMIRDTPQLTQKIPDWVPTQKTDADEMVVISHMWEEIRRLMWSYVGIVRSNKRLERAQHRLENLMREVLDYYVNLKVHPDILELRNIALVASLTVECALKRRESRGIHYNIDYPEPDASTSARDTVL